MWLVFGTNLSFPELDNKVEAESVYVVHQTPLFQNDMFFYDMSSFNVIF